MFCTTQEPGNNTVSLHAAKIYRSWGTLNCWNRRDSLAKGDVIYRRSLQEIEVKELRVGGIIHLGPLVNTEQTRAQAGQGCSGVLAPLGGQSILGPWCQARRFLLQGCYYIRQGKSSMPLGISRGLEGFFLLACAEHKGDFRSNLCPGLPMPWKTH